MKKYYKIVYMFCIVFIISAPYIRGFLNNVSIHKCHCQSGHAWHHGRCTQRDTYVPILQLPTWQEISVNSLNINVPVIDRVRCKSEQLLVPLKEGSFSITDTGQLFHWLTGLFFTLDDYCVEHVFTPTDHTRLEALACIARPLVPKCCHAGLYENTRTMKCVRKSNSTFRRVFGPPILMEPSILKWPFLASSSVGFPACLKSEAYHRVSLDRTIQPRGSLLYRSNGIFLRLNFKQDGSNLPIVFDSKDYCVGAREERGILSYSAIYCDVPHDLSQYIRLKEKENIYSYFYILPVVLVRLLMPADECILLHDGIK